MWKRLIIGDIHGISSWIDIYNKEQPNEVIVLGDYFDSFSIDSNIQILNFKEMLEWKDAHDASCDKKFIMLLGNHDYHYLPNVTEHYSGYNRETSKEISNLIYDLIDNGKLKIVYLDSVNKIIFSHAGVSKKWFDENVEDLSLIDNAPLSSFRFTYKDGGDWYGSSEYSSPLWIRPEGLMKGPYPEWNQIYGHTNIECPTKETKDDLYYINLDSLDKGYYMIQTLDDEGKLVESSFRNIFENIECN